MIGTTLDSNVKDGAQIVVIRTIVNSNVYKKYKQRQARANLKKRKSEKGKSVKENQKPIKWENQEEDHLKK